jgi:hypothetical protein
MFVRAHVYAQGEKVQSEIYVFIVNMETRRKVLHTCPKSQIDEYKGASEACNDCEGPHNQEGCIENIFGQMRRTEWTHSIGEIIACPMDGKDAKLRDEYGHAETSTGHLIE